MTNSTTYTNDTIGNPIPVGSNVVYVGSYNSGNLNVGTVVSINYDENKVVIPDEKYPISADEVVVYD